jgi:cytochrome c oxidase subunit II
MSVPASPPERAHANALDPAAPGARELADLWWALLVLGGAVFVAVGAVVLALLVRAWLARTPARAAPGEAGAGEWKPIVAAGVVGSLVVLTAVMVLTVAPGRSEWSPAGREFRVGPEAVPPRPADAGQPLRVEVDGHRFWWAVRYPDEGIVTANEIVVPVGRVVRFALRTDDVIHSFWIPSFAGKVDMIPGKVNRLQVRAEREGEFLGKCAEFCGIQHTLMEFRVRAVAPEAYEAWAAERRAAAEAPPAGTAAQRGEQVFAEQGCGTCHRIAGTAARGVLGPDLTHVASRATLGAGAVPNTRGHLAGWITDPQSIKPGNLMPAVRLEPAELQDLLDYLEALR